MFENFDSRESFDKEPENSESKENLKQELRNSYSEKVPENFKTEENLEKSKNNNLSNGECERSVDSKLQKNLERKIKKKA